MFSAAHTTRDFNLFETHQARQCMLAGRDGLFRGIALSRVVDDCAELA